MRRRIVKPAILLSSVALLFAAEPGWRSKPTDKWSEADAKQFLASSPWIGKATPALLPNRSEFSHRDGGVMGAGQGLGIDGLSAGSLLGLGGSQPTQHGRRPSMTEPLQIRWESAPPVRAAETTAHEQDSPEIDSALYAIAIYDVPGLNPNQKTLPRDLQKDAFLKSDGRKDRRPSRVDVLPQDNGLATVVYMFPRTDEITLAEQRLTFTAIIGRLSLAQYFYLDRMQIAGKLQL